MFNTINDFFSATTVVDALYLVAFGVLAILALRTMAKVLNYAIELAVRCFAMAKAGGFTLKSTAAALATLATKSFDAAAPLLVLAIGAGALLFNSFGMIAFDPNPSVLNVLGFQGLNLAIVWRSVEAYLEHVQHAMDKLKSTTEVPSASPATQPPAPPSTEPPATGG